MIHRFFIAVAGFAAILGSATGAWAQSAATPDKSGYWLFNPTPPDEERAFCTDRPTKSTGACTVDAGHFQYETDLVNYTYARAGASRPRAGWPRTRR